MNADGSGTVDITDVLSALSPAYANAITGVSSASLAAQQGMNQVAGVTIAGLSSSAPVRVPTGPAYNRIFQQGWQGASTPKLH